ncbi:MAG: dihydrolipoyl dehydrogenase family protein [Candidatus Nanopelagicales bacterium]
MTTTADVIVLGLGPGGEQVATDLLSSDLSVIGIEAELVGGECPYWGCIPSKMAIRAATTLAEGERVNKLAGAATITPDWSPVAARIRAEATDDWNDQAAVDRFVDAGGIFVRGRGTITGPNSVRVGEQQLTATRALVIATGTSAAVPPVEGLAGIDYWTNRDALKTESVPDSLVVLGGGAIGCELAQVFRRFGADVTIVEFAPRLISAEEPEAGEILAQTLEDDGIALRLGVAAEGVSGEGPYTVVLSDGGEVSGQKVLVATGRRVDLAAINADALDESGLAGDGRSLPTDDYLRVLRTDGLPLEGVYGVGDVVGKGAFTHVAVTQGRMVADQILGKDTTAFDKRAVGHVTFTDPEVGAVGLTEAKARASGIDVAIATYPMESVSRAWIHGPPNAGILKVVVDNSTAAIIGATVVGPHAGEVLAGLTVAVAAKVPVSTLVTTVWAYPTYHRGFDAVLAELPAQLRPTR